MSTIRALLDQAEADRVIVWSKEFRAEFEAQHRANTVRHDHGDTVKPEATS